MVWVGPGQNGTGYSVYVQELNFGNAIVSVTTCSAQYANTSTDCNSDGIPDQCEYLNSTSCSTYVPVVTTTNSVVTFPYLNPDFLIQPKSSDGSTSSNQSVLVQFPAWYEIDSSGNIVQAYNMSNDYNLLATSGPSYDGIYFQPKEWTQNLYIEWEVVVLTEDGYLPNDTTKYNTGTVKWSINAFPSCYTSALWASFEA
jgi:hypothetical protein